MTYCRIFTGSSITHCSEKVIWQQPLKDMVIKKSLPIPPKKKATSLSLYASGIPVEMFSSNFNVVIYAQHKKTPLFQNWKHSCSMTLNMN